jgi:hypothetical protein
MLYSLQIVEAILLDEGQDDKRKERIKRFVGLGGLKELQRQLHSALLSIKTESSSTKKKYVD